MLPKSPSIPSPTDDGVGRSGRDGFWRLRASSDELLHTDLMRFIAASGIVLTHSFRFLLPRAQRMETDFGSGLSFFVDVFFVISGFVIAHVYANRIASWRDFGRFIQRRIGRLMPLHLITFGASIAMFAAAAALNFHVDNAPTLSFECLSTAALLLHAVIICGGNIPNGVSWSISAEMLMYLLFPIFIFIGNRLKYGLIGLFVVALVAAYDHYEGMHNWIDLDAFRAFPAFVLGIVLQRSRPLLAAIPHAWGWAIVSTVLLVVGSFFGWSFAVLLMLAYLCATLALAADCTGPANPTVARLAPLGQLTYGIYMIHLLVITTLVNGIGDKLLKLPVGRLSIVLIVSYAIIGMLSLASFKYVEGPARRWIDRLPMFKGR